MQTRKEPPGSFFYCRGFTIMELVAVILIAGVIAVVALSRFSTSAFDEVRFYDETSAALRYAQATAVATQRTVCVTFTATQLTLHYAPIYGDTTCLPANGLAPPGGLGGAPYTVTAQGSAGYALPLPADFTFDRVGRPSAPQTINLNGRQILVEAETGYVH